MQLRRKSRMTSEVSTSSLNDIMFFLMLFFLIMSTMVVHTVKINLPKTNAGQTVTKQSIVLAIDSNKNYFLNEKPITFNDIETQLTHLIQTDTAKGSTIILQASKKLNLQDVVDVMGIGAKLKLKMSLATTNK
jgi:biopolymer transport protein ExbD